VLAEAYNYEYGLNRNFVYCLSNERRHKENCEWNLQVSTSQTSQIEKWIGDLNELQEGFLLTDAAIKTVKKAFRFTNLNRLIFNFAIIPSSFY
jgi:hypothetical protein